MNDEQMPDPGNPQDALQMLIRLAEDHIDGEFMPPFTSEYRSQMEQAVLTVKGCFREHKAPAGVPPIVRHLRGGL